MALTMGIRKLIVAVNKMDHVKYSQNSFDEILKKASFSLTKLGFKQFNITFIPISAWEDVNLTYVDKSITPWYKGPSLMEKIKEIEEPDMMQAMASKPLRIKIHNYNKIGGIGTVLVGKVFSGTLKAKTPVYVGPYNYT
jgi:elongation factor 1-alpha